MGLAAAGVISFAAVAQAEEKPTHQVLTAVSSTALSGYVSTSVGWAPGKAVPAPLHSFSKAADSFNLDVIDIKLSSALAEGEWASGYNIELWLGPDAAGLGNNLGTSAAIKNANVALNIPIGNGIQAKLGIFDSIVGYESANSIENPNFTRSLGYTLEPTSHTGLLLSYKACDAVSVSGGVANSYNADLNVSRGASSQHTWMAAASLTAPDSLGFLKGAVLTLGVVDGFFSTGTTGTLPGVGTIGPIDSSDPDVTLYYVGATLPTGITGLNFGVTWDRLSVNQADFAIDAFALYASYKLSEKATFNVRAEYLRGDTQAELIDVAAATTLTLDYKLWANVVSRIEYRWDHDLSGNNLAAETNGNPSRNNAHTIMAQIAYKF